MLGDVADVAGNKLDDPSPRLHDAGAAEHERAVTVVAVHPGVPCTLTGGQPRRARAAAPAATTATTSTSRSRCRADEPIEVAFSQPPSPASVTHGTSCNTGSVRIEEVDAGGAALAPAVGGTLIAR